MKTFWLTLSLIALAGRAFAQGSITFANTTTTQFRTNLLAIPGGTAGLALSANGPFYYELLTAPSTVTSVDVSLQALLTPTWSDTGLQATNGPLAGRLSTSRTTMNNWAPGVFQSYIVVGWSANLGTSWSQVSAELNGSTFLGGLWRGPMEDAFSSWIFLGATGVYLRQAGGVVGSSTIPTPAIFDTVDDAQGTVIKTQTDMFTAGPEPSTGALVGLGLVLWIVRRRKAWPVSRD
jgi:hypothetical protein